MAVTSLVAADRGNARGAARLRRMVAGSGTARCCSRIGLPLIFLKSSLPGWLEASAEKAVGVVILALAVRVIAKWVRGDYRTSRHGHERAEHRRRTTGRSVTSTAAERRPSAHARANASAGACDRPPHGLAGTGAVVLLADRALPTKLEAAAALLVFAPATVASMAACTSAFAWVLTRPVIEPVSARC